MQPFRKFTNATSGGVPGLTSASGGTAIADNVVIRGDGTTGIQGSSAILSDAGELESTTFKVGGGPIITRSTSAVSIGTNSPPIFGGDGSSLAGVFLADAGVIRWNNGNPTYGNGDSGLKRVASGVVGITNGTTGLGLLQTEGFKRKTADQTVTDSTTYVDDTHLTLSLAAGRSYKFRFHLFCTVVATSQIKVRLGGTATHTDLISDIRVFDPAVPVYDAASIVDSTTVANHTISSSALSPSGIITIEGTTTVNAAGTFLVQFAQDAETVAAESAILLRGSTLEVWDIA